MRVISSAHRIKDLRRKELANAVELTLEHADRTNCSGEMGHEFCYRGVRLQLTGAQKRGIVTPFTEPSTNVDAPAPARITIDRNTKGPVALLDRSAESIGIDLDRDLLTALNLAFTADGRTHDDLDGDDEL